MKETRSWFFNGSKLQDTAISSSRGRPRVLGIALTAVWMMATGVMAQSRPVVTSSATAQGKVHAFFKHQVSASNAPTRFSAMGLPGGLSINAQSGLIQGTILGRDGLYNATVTASNAAGGGVQKLALTVLPELPVINSKLKASGRTGQAFLYQTTALKFPRSFSASGLPSGLGMNASTGLISGVPTSAGNATVTLRAINGAGAATQLLQILIAPPPPVVTSAATAQGKVQTSFRHQITASNTPTKFTATGLPGGLSINATSGLIQGTVTGRDGLYSASISAINAGGSGVQKLAITITASTPVVSSSGSAVGKVGQSFRYRATALNFPLSFAASGLPAGLTIDTASGVISGIPTAIDGIYNATLTATNAGGSGTKNLAITIAPALPVITSGGDATAWTGQFFRYQIAATNFPRTFTASGLPAGLTLNATTGLLSGIAQSSGNTTITLLARNGAGAASLPLRLSVRPPALAITTTSLPAGQTGTPFANTFFTATGGSGNLSWSLSEGFLPKGMNLNAASGLLSGTPAQSGVHTFAVRVADAVGQLDELEVVLAVDNPAAGTVVSDVLSALPAGSPLTQSAGNATCNFQYQSSGSTWIAEANEEQVFLASVTSSSGWRLGIGKGGQIYSLRGPFGETVPPQRADARWVDEAWQFVATNTDLVTPVHEFQSTGAAARRLAYPIQFFIHQSGIYQGELTGNSIVGSPTAPLYSPVLKKRWNPDTRTLSVVNWSQMARSPNVWKSGLLTYASYRDLGNGAIEVTNFVTNFGDQDLNFFNTPWGGARPSTLPETILSSSNGTWTIAPTGLYGSNTPLHLRNTGGWQAWVQNASQEQSGAMAVVFGNQTLPGVSAQEWSGFRRFLTYGLTHPGRDYAVSSIQNSIRLQPGQSLACRWHLVLGPFGETRTKASALAVHAGLWFPETDAAALATVWTTGGIPSGLGTGTPDLHLFAQPLPGAVPVFSMEDTRTGRVFATFDPYELCPTAPYPNPLPASHPQYALYQNRVVYYQYSSPGVLKELLGYAFPTQPPLERHIRVSLPGANGSLFLWVPAPTVR